MADRNVVIQGLIELHLAGKGGDEAVASMQKILAQTKQVEASVGGFGTATKKTTEEVGKLERGMASLGRTVAGYFAAGVVANFLRDSYIGFARTERQALAVENQIKALGQAAQGAGFRDFIAMLSQSSGIIDDELFPAFQRAILAFKDFATAQAVTERAARFAAAGIGDVQSNAEAMARFFNTGSARSLVQFGVNVKGGEAAVLSLTEGFRLLDEQLAKQAASFDDAQSRLDALNRLTDTFGDSVGELIDKVAELTLKYSQSPFAIAARGALPGAQAAGAVFGPADNPLARAAAAEQERREADARKKATEESLKAEADRLAKVADLNEKSAQDLIKSVAELYEQGSDERYYLELELNKRVETAAIESAKKIGADTLAIAAFFAGERGKLAAARGETASQKAAREQAALFDPRAEYGLVEAAAQEHEDRMAEIIQAGREQSAQIKVNLAQDEREAMDAQMELELLQLQAASDARVKAAEGDRDAIILIRQQQAEAEAAIRRLNEIATEQSEKRSRATAVAAAGATFQAMATIFNDNKAMQYAATIVNTASAIMSALATPPYYVGVALAVAAAAQGAAQLATIRRTQIGSGGGGADVASVGSAGVASYPTTPSVAPPSQSQIDSITGSRTSTPSVTIHIANAFGDDQSMNRLARRLTSAMRNDQSALR